MANEARVSQQALVVAYPPDGGAARLSDQWIVVSAALDYVAPPSPPSPAAAGAPGVKRAVLYLCEKAGARILAYGDGISQVGDDYQAALETWEVFPEGETGRNMFRAILVAIDAVGAHTIGVTPIIDGAALPEQLFSGSGDGEETYRAFFAKAGTAIACRIRTILRSGPLEVKNVSYAVFPVRAFP